MSCDDKNVLGVEHFAFSRFHFVSFLWSHLVDLAVAASLA
jgi:hypothetical protein